ncbi:hypothetical protein IQ06DRAFT_295472 [Phaeosphaeriaceae sp. SRC1lsM3a]|nr:hypothetical protein IQ06DRAFT_295472 [Stagonospora sp. SRC1lsM3a]
MSVDEAWRWHESTLDRIREVEFVQTDERRASAVQAHLSIAICALVYVGDIEFSLVVLLAP